MSMQVSGNDAPSVYLEEEHELLRAQIRRFVDQESRVYLTRFYRIYRGHSPDEALAILAHRTRPIARCLAVVFQSVRPDAGRCLFKNRLGSTQASSSSPQMMSAGVIAFLISSACV